jgi:hypothetical protein
MPRATTIFATACEQGQRREFMVVAQPLRLPGRTGSPFNRIAIR